MGIPSLVATITHDMAPIRAARIRYSVIISGLIIPFPMVLATATPKPNAAAKFQKAAHNTA